MKVSVMERERERERGGGCLQLKVRRLTHLRGVDEAEAVLPQAPTTSPFSPRRRSEWPMTTDDASHVFF